MAVVMVPTGWHRRSQEDWHSTAGTPVPFSKYGQLTHDQLRWLTYAFPDGAACFWARSKYDDMPQPRDQAWFHMDGFVIGIGEVRAAFDNPDLAGVLWQDFIPTEKEKGLPTTPAGWRYIFAFEKPRPSVIDKRAINQIVGFKPGNRWQGTHRLSEDQSTALQSRLVWTIR